MKLNGKVAHCFNVLAFNRKEFSWLAYNLISNALAYFQRIYI